LMKTGNTHNGVATADMCGAPSFSCAPISRHLEASRSWMSTVHTESKTEPQTR